MKIFIKSLTFHYLVAILVAMNELSRLYKNSLLFFAGVSAMFFIFGGFNTIQTLICLIGISYLLYKTEHIDFDGHNFSYMFLSFVLPSLGIFLMLKDLHLI